MWSLLGRLLDNPAGAALVFLSLSAAFVAAGIYGVRFVRTMRGKNGSGNGDDTGELLNDLDGLGLPKPPRQQGGPFVIAQASGAAHEVALVKDSVRKLDERVTGPGGLQERIANLEQTCRRTEAEVKAMRKESKEDMAAQTIELSGVMSRQILAAFEALDKQTDEKIKAAKLGEDRSDGEPA